MGDTTECMAFSMNNIACWRTLDRFGMYSFIFIECVLCAFAWLAIVRVPVTWKIEFLPLETSIQFHSEDKCPLKVKVPCKD